MGVTTPIWRKPHTFYYWAPPILWGLAVLSMSGNLGSSSNTRGMLHWLLSWFMVLTPAQLNLVNFYARKTGHVLSYFFMYFLWFRAFRWHAGRGSWCACLCSLGFCLLYASLDEGRQWFHPSRGGNTRDILLDMSGASLGALFTAVVCWPQGGLVASIPSVSLGQRLWGLRYWFLPILWSLAMLPAPESIVPITITLGPLKWWVSWFALVDSYELKILNAYLWQTGRVLAFGILYVLWFRALQRYAGANGGRSCLGALMLCLVVVMISQVFQTFTRAPGDALFEVILSLSGAGLAALVTAAVWQPRRPVLALPVIAGESGHPRDNL